MNGGSLSLPVSLSWDFSKITQLFTKKRGKGEQGREKEWISGWMDARKGGSRKGR